MTLPSALFPCPALPSRLAARRPVARRAAVAGVVLSLCLLLVPAGVHAAQEPERAAQETERTAASVAPGDESPAAPDPELPGRQYRDLGRPPDPPIRPLRTPGLPLDVAALMYSGQQGGVVPFAVLAVPRPAEKGVSRVGLVIDVDAQAFARNGLATSGAPSSGGAASGVGAACEGTARLEVYVYALSDQNVLLDTLLQTFEVDMDRVDPCPAEAGVRFAGELSLAAGSNASLRVLVRTGPERIGLRVVTLAVPPPPGESSAGRDAAARARARLDHDLAGIDRGGSTAAARGPRLSPPLLDARSDGPLKLVEVREPGEPRPSAELVESPPPARPVVERGGEVTLRVLATGLETMQSDWRAELSDFDGRPLAEIPARVVRYGAPSDDGQRAVELAFRADGLPYGAMQLRMAMAAGRSDDPDDDLRSPSLQIAVVDSLEPREARSDRPDAAPGAAPGVDEVELKRIREQWEPILALYAAGDESTARRRLFDLCLRLSESHGMEGLRGLGRITLRGVAELRESVGAAALPVALLQFELYREARRRGESLVSTHARELMVELLRRWSDDESGAAVPVAEGYVLLASELQRSALVRYSSALYSRAAELDPRQTAALLGLGMNYEYVGDPGEAQSLYGDLLDIDPSHGLARLRRAVNLETLGRTRPARRELERLLEMPPENRAEDWVQAVAYQELARLLLDDGEVGTARDLLERATDELPRNERLYLLLAFVHDALGDGGQARGVLTEMAIRTAGARGLSPRHRYTLWATDAQAGIHRRLRERAGPVREALDARWASTGAFTSDEEATR